MNVFSKTYCRFIQFFIKTAQRFLTFRTPDIKEDLFDVISIVKNKNLHHLYIVSGKHVSKIKKVQSFLEELKKENIQFTLNTEVQADPTIHCINNLFLDYKKENCDSILAIGGGSVLDACKALGILIVSKQKDLNHYRGILKVHHNLPFFIACPTTAGTGSEATVAAVITDERTNDKFAISDPHLIPSIAILDSSLLESLPQSTIAITGMDAFCHALEAYIGKGSLNHSDSYALQAIEEIKDNLLPFYESSQNEKARKKMLFASFYAGLSFTRAYVGYIHALAHAIGGKYHLPHGYCIAILMPYVLKAYGKSAEKKLSEIAVILDKEKEIGNRKQRAMETISFIESLNKQMNIPSSFKGAIKKEDYKSLALHAKKEANPLYPVPKEFSVEELEEIIASANENGNE